MSDGLRLFSGLLKGFQTRNGVASLVFCRAYSAASASAAGRTRAAQNRAKPRA